LKLAEGGQATHVPPPRGLNHYFTLSCTGKETLPDWNSS
jgi:hypothetical protein